MSASVVLADTEPNGLAEMLARLLESNLARDPARARLLAPALVEVQATDARVGATVRVGPGGLEVANGAGQVRPAVRIRADAQDLLALTSAPLRFGFPDPLRRAGRAVLARVLSRRVRVSGMIRHPIVLSRFARLLSVA